MRYNPNSVSLNHITCNQIVNNVPKFLYGSEVALGAPWFRTWDHAMALRVFCLMRIRNKRNLANNIWRLKQLLSNTHLETSRLYLLLHPSCHRPLFPVRDQATTFWIIAFNNGECFSTHLKKDAFINVTTDCKTKHRKLQRDKNIQPTAPNCTLNQEENTPEYNQMWTS